MKVNILKCDGRVMIRRVKFGVIRIVCHKYLVCRAVESHQ